MRQMINISQPDLGKEEWNVLKDSIFSGWITQGPKVKEFEEQFAKRHNVKYALAVSNCTTALHLALLALGIGPGDEVILPSFTWVATANAVVYCGAKPVLVDIDLKTYNIDTNKIKKALTKKTKAIIPVHLFGLCADIDELKRVAPGIFLVEDAACAAGARYKGKPAGSLGDIACFSLHPRKVITTGEGGVITTNNKKIAKMIDMLRNHGASISEEQRHAGPKPYFLPKFDVIGYNYRMTDLQGAIGIVQLEKLEKLIQEREKWAFYYQQKLAEIEWLHTPNIPKGYLHGWQSFVCFVDEDKAPFSRNKIMDILFNKGISTRPGTHAVHSLSIYKKLFRFSNYTFPNSYKAASCSMALPFHNRMKGSDYDYVIKTIRSIR